VKLVDSSEIIPETGLAFVSLPCVPGQVPIRTHSTEARHFGGVMDIARTLFPQL
jgi:hypothetical protein